MRRLILLLLLALVAALALLRLRVYVRDPLARVERAGAPVPGAEVYINFANDVLLQQAGSLGTVLVQGRGAVPGVPEHLACLRGLVCLTDADTAAVQPLESGRPQMPGMSASRVSFAGADGVQTAVQLR